MDGMVLSSCEFVVVRMQYIFALEILTIYERMKTVNAMMAIEYLMAVGCCWRNDDSARSTLAMKISNSDRAIIYNVSMCQWK